MSFVCQRCQQAKATVHITDTVPEKRERHLCEECARSAGVGFKFTFSISDVLGNLVEGETEKKSEKQKDYKCTHCGMKFSEFRKKARLGCTHDYEVFKNALIPLLEKINGWTQHVGKVPKTVDVQVRKENELIRLKRDLDNMVKAEKFEKAATLRDRIKVLETDLAAVYDSTKVVA